MNYTPRQRMMVREAHVKLNAGDLRQIIREESGIIDPEEVKTHWMSYSGGLAPDEVDPDDYEGILDRVASALNIDDDLALRSLIHDWGDAASMDALSDTLRRGRRAGPSR